MSKNGLIKKIIISAMAFTMVFSLAGCGEIRLAENMSPDLLLSVNNEKCMMTEGIFRLMEVKDEYNPDEELFWERQIGDLTMEQYIKESVFDEMKRITSSVLMAEEMGLYLSAEELSDIKTRVGEAFEKVSRTHNTGSYNITREDVEHLYTKIAMYEKVFAKVTESVKIEISEADTKVIEVNYVEIPLGMSTNDIEAIRSEIKSGTSFERACVVAGLAPHMNVQLMKGQMPEAFENVAYVLTDGELSEIVVTSECNYLIQCIEDYMISESAANNNKVLSQARADMFNEKYNDLAGRVLLRVNQEKWDEVNIREI